MRSTAANAARIARVSIHDTTAQTFDETQYRIEKDSMGDVRVPVDAKWRAQTQRASGQRGVKQVVSGV